MARLIKTKVEFEGVWHDQEVVLDGEDLAPWPQDAPLEVVGRPLARVDALARAAGRVVYTQDVRLPGMLHAKVLRAPHAHARLVKLDVEPALAAPGVAAVLSRENAPKMPWYGDRSQLFDDHVRYAGEEVAVVAAASEDQAADALERIVAEYEVLEPVFDPEAALAPAAPRLFPAGNAAGESEPYRRGDPEQGFRDADVTVGLELRTPGAVHNPLETHGSVAWWAGDKLTVWDSTQNIHGVRAALAQRFELPLSRVRVISDYMGGGFGAKNGLRKYTVLAALLSRRTGRPVRLVMDREEQNLCVGHRSPAVVRVRLGAKRDGRLTAIHVNSVSSVGAYGSGSMPITGPAKTLYACPSVLAREVAARTSTGPHTAFRAPGYVEGTTALETAIDELARALDLDPVAVRRKNHAEKDPASGLPYSGKALDECLRRAVDLLGTRRLPADGPRRRGVGIACGVWGAGGGPPAYATVKLNRDASAVVLTGTQDIGTGARTVLAQIAAEELGVKVSSVEVVLGDTEVGLYAPLSAGSMTLASMGPAVRLAAADAARKLKGVVARKLGVGGEGLTLKDGQVLGGASPVPLAEVLASLEEFTIVGHGTRHPNPAGTVIKSFGAHAAEVEVDVETGEVRVLRYAAVHDIGRVVNPLTATSQVAGGVIMGLGYALLEERVIDPETGRVLNPNLCDYRVPTASDRPWLHVAFVDRADESANNIGARGLGEPPIIPVAAAISNAVRDAIGRRVDTLPITPARVLAALGRAPLLGGETEIRAGRGAVPAPAPPRRARREARR